MRSTWLSVAVGAIIAANTAAASDFVFPQSGRCSSNYYSSRPYGIHQALDIVGPNGSAVTAARAGRVTFYGVNGGYGNLMIVTHENGYTTYYAHLSRSARGVGSNVNAGDTIAYEGSTGNSTGPHVHFEVRRYGTKQLVPGAVGAYFTRGNGLPHDYAGIGGDAGGGGGGQTGGGTTGENLAFRVTASALNVRTGPGTGNASMGTIPNGQVYVSEAKNGDWHRIWYDGRSGWCHGGYLARTSATGRLIDADTLNVRSGPGTNHSAVAQVHRGQRYVQADRSGDWLKIYFKGTTRWIHGGYTRWVGY